MKNLFYSALLLNALLVVNFSVTANDKTDAEKIVNNSLKTLNTFAIDPNQRAFQKDLKRAKGFLIIPTFYKGGVGLGGSAGTGVLLRKYPDEGQVDISVMDQWSYPAFYTMGSVSLGLQIGGKVAEVIMVILSEKGLDAFLSSQMQLGADASIAAGPVGKGTQVFISDIIIYSRSVGAFGGLTGEGSYITAGDSLNSAYYGKQVSPLDILVTGRAGNIQANDLRARLTSLTSH
jgi:lipid-binding SYLF domain-containing protein